MKQDSTWEDELEDGFGEVYREHGISLIPISSFIRTHFLSREEVAKVIEELQRANSESTEDPRYKHGADSILNRLKDRLGI